MAWGGYRHHDIIYRLLSAGGVINCRHMNTITPISLLRVVTAMFVGYGIGYVVNGHHIGCVGRSHCWREHCQRHGIMATRHAGHRPCCLVWNTTSRINTIIAITPEIRHVMADHRHDMLGVVCLLCGFIVARGS